MIIKFTKKLNRFLVFVFLSILCAYGFAGEKDDAVHKESKWSMGIYYTGVSIVSVSNSSDAMKNIYGGGLDLRLSKVINHSSTHLAIGCPKLSVQSYCGVNAGVLTNIFFDNKKHAIGFTVGTSKILDDKPKGVADSYYRSIHYIQLPYTYFFDSIDLVGRNFSIGLSINYAEDRVDFSLQDAVLGKQIKSHKNSETDIGVFMSAGVQF